MPSLSDLGVMQSYANIAVDIYRHASRFGAEHRRMQFEGAMRQALRTCGIPEPRIEWIDGGASFNYREWAIRTTKWAYIDAGDPDLKWWLACASQLYHEARHAEQYWLAALAMMKGTLPLPISKRGRQVLPANDGVNTRGQWLEIGWGFPQRILLQADIAKNRFQDSMIPQTRAWIDSFFGSSHNYAGFTQSHLVGRKHKSMNPYIHLAEEADAWAVERQVKRLIKAGVQAYAGAEALEGVAGLFD